MSMIGNFLLVSDEDLDALISAPKKVHALLDQRVYDPEQPVDYVDVDKAWHALHFMLTGTAWKGDAPLDFIAVGGVPIGDEDVGYGAARALRSKELAVLQRALEPITVDALITRYDGKAMEDAEIYPGGWTKLDPRDPNEFGYFSGAYEELRALVRKGAETSQGLLIWVS